MCCDCYHALYERDHVRIMLFFNFKSFQLTHYYQRFSSGYIRSALADSVDYSANKSGTRVHIFSKVLFFFSKFRCERTAAYRRSLTNLPYEFFVGLRRRSPWVINNTLPSARFISTMLHRGDRKASKLNKHGKQVAKVLKICLPAFFS